MVLTPFDLLGPVRVGTGEYLGRERTLALTSRNNKGHLSSREEGY